MKRYKVGAVFVTVLVALLVVSVYTPYGRHQQAHRIRWIEAQYRVPLPARSTLLSDLVVVTFDTETTGVNPNYDRLLEVGAAKYRGGRLIQETNWMIHPQQFVPLSAQEIHGIGPEDLRDARAFDVVYPEIAAFFAGAVLIAHNANFDIGFLRAEILRAGYPLPSQETIDTMQYFRRMLPDLPSYRLASIASALGIEGGTFHRALDDAKYTAEIFFKLTEQQLGPAATLDDVMRRAGNVVPF